MSLSLSLKRAALMSCVATVGLLGTCVAAMAGSAGEQTLKNRTIGYLMTDNQWAIYQTAGAKEECPNGLSKWGPRERFKVMFPDNGTKHTLKETQIALEGTIWNPKVGPDKFDYAEAAGKISYGLNLDGKVGPNDFTTPEGDTGIDNQLFRVIGCDDNMRGPSGPVYGIGHSYLRNGTFSKVLLELTNVEDLTNDPDVDVTVTRGLDKWVTDAGGDIVLPGGTQRVDTRWTKKFTQHHKGKIVNGVLMTEPGLVRILNARNRTPVEDLMYDGRFQLKLTAERAEGVIAGYVDFRRFYLNFNREFATFVQAYGRSDAHAWYNKLTELADGHPDPKTGANTGISGAMLVKFAQVFIEYPDKQVAAKAGERKSTH